MSPWFAVPFGRAARLCLRIPELLMSTDTFRRHARACVDAALHRVFLSLRARPDQASLFERLLHVVQRRSDLMTRAPSGPGDVAQVDVLHNLLRFERSFVRVPEAWPGMIGHPSRVVDSLAGHLFARYPTPRFLASAWFGPDTSDRIDRRRWYVAHAQGRSFRRLALPLALTRRMMHVFLHDTPDHLAIDPALRRAEILGLGGTRELADAVLATNLAEDFREPERWRVALRWLVGCGDSVDLAQLRPLVDFLRANLHTVELRGRTFASAMRLVRDWHGWLGRSRTRFVSWPRSRWSELVVPVEPTPTEPRRAEWTIIELVDSHQLAHEGRVMRHCVATYARACAAGSSSIWSVRHRWCGEPGARSVLTIEVRTTTRTIVQVRGVANSRPRGWPAELVRRWAAHQRLLLHRAVSPAHA